MTKSETISFLKAYLNGDTNVGNVISLRSVLEAAVENLEPPLPSNLDEAAEAHRRKVFYGDPDYSQLLRETFKAGAEWMAGWGVKIGETKIYLEDDGDEPPYAQEWLDLESTEFKIPDGAFKDGEEVEVILRKKQ